MGFVVLFGLVMFSIAVGVGAVETERHNKLVDACESGDPVADDDFEPCPERRSFPEEAGEVVAKGAAYGLTHGLIEVLVRSVSK